MSRKRALKVLVWVFGILIVLVIGGYVTLRVILPSERLRAMVLPRVEEALGQRVEVGPVHLTIWGGFGLSVEEIRIGNRPGYEDEYMLDLDEVILRVPLRPLLSRRLEVRKIAIVRPRIFIEKSGEGALNVAGLGRRLSPPPEGAPPPRAGRPISLPIPITLESFTIESGSLRFRDNSTGLQAAVGKIDHSATLSLDPSLSDALARGQLSAEQIHLTLPGLSSPLPPFGVEISHRTRADLAHSVLTLEEVRISIMNAELGLTGTVEDFEKPLLNLSTDASVDLERLAVSSETSLRGVVRSMIRVEGPLLQPEDLTLHGTISVERVAVQNPALPVPLTDLGGEILFQGQDVEIPGFTGSLGASSFRVKCRAERAIPFAATGGNVVPKIHFEVRSPHLAMDELLPEPEQASPEAGGAEGRPTTPELPQIPPLPELEAEGTILVEKITARGLEANDLYARIEAAEKRVRVPEFSVNLYSGKIHGVADANLEDASDLPFSVTVDADGLEANDFVSALTPFDDHLFGRLDMRASFDARGATPLDIKRTLSGGGHVSVTEGRLVDWELARKLSRWIKFLDFDDLEFQNLDVDFEVAEERVSMRPLKLTALDTGWNAEGWTGFDGSLDYRVTATLSRSAVRSLKERLSLPKALSIDAGQTELEFAISGTARAPKFRWVTESLQERAKERAEQEVRDFVGEKKNEARETLLKEVDRRLEGEAEEKARTLVEGLLRPDSTDSTGQKAVEELKKEGENLLRDLFKKKKPKD